MNSTFKVEIGNDLAISSMECEVGTLDVAMTYIVLCDASSKCTYLKGKHYNRLCMSFTSSIRMIFTLAPPPPLKLRVAF
jgi:hypothetical protein